jgi:hypothetical protein
VSDSRRNHRNLGPKADGVDYTELGIGVKQDMEAAKRWYQRAAGGLLSIAIPYSTICPRSGNEVTPLMCPAQQHKRAMQRLTELNSARNAKGKRAPGRPTRNEASSECVIM